MADCQFQNMIISKYDSFKSYLRNTDISTINLIKGVNERIKTLRAKRKEKRCSNCNSILTIKTDFNICKSCGFVGENKPSRPLMKIKMDYSKHIYKQSDAIVGIRKPPNNILKIINYLSIWLTDLKFIGQWLINSRRQFNIFTSKYNSFTDDVIVVSSDDSFFNRVIERKPQNMWPCHIYKLFADEFYLLLENIKRHANLGVSNIESLKDADKAIFLRNILKRIEMSDQKRVRSLNSLSKVSITINGKLDFILTLYR
jgi:hypothetical protein